MDALEVPDGVALHFPPDGRAAPSGQLAVYLTAGGVAVVPGEVRFSYGARALSGPEWGPAWQDVVSWEGGAASDTPRALLGSHGVVALKVRVKAYTGAAPDPVPPPEFPPCLVYVPLPMPARVWGPLPGMESSYHIPIALVTAQAIIHQLTLGPLTVGDLGRSVRVRRHYEDFTS